MNDTPAPTPPADAPATLRWAALSAVAFVAGLVIVSQGDAPHPARFLVLLAVLIQEGALAAAWLVAAAGFGWPLRRWLLGKSPVVPLIDSVLLQLAMGIGALLLLDWLAAWAGLMTAMTAWGLGIVGCGLLLGQTGFRRRDLAVKPALQRIHWICIPAALGAGAMLGATTVAPGGLWLSEFSGYDVLEYHLQLPREWLGLGGIAGLKHNAYSYMPNLFECAFMHLGVWRGGMVAGSYASQMLHAGMAIIAAMLITRVTATIIGEERSVGALFAGAIYLVVPWTIVTGSMAYTEQAMMAMAAAAALVVVHIGREHFADRELFAAGAVGFLLGIACLCKLTAGPMLALPILLVMARQSKGKTPTAQLVVTIGAMLAVCGIWMVRNAVWTGNPVFPMFTSTFGTAHWTTEQAARWTHAHSAPPLAEWPARVRSQWLGHEQYGIALWVAGAVAAWLCWREEKTERAAKGLMMVTALQIAAWLMVTHQQARFAIPMLLPTCVLIGLASHHVRMKWPLLPGGLLAGWLVFISVGYYMHPQQATSVNLIAGDALIQQQVQPYSVLNDVDLVPANSVIYAEGFATPFYVKPRIDYHTVWDTSPLGQAIAETGSVNGAIDRLRAAGYTHLLVDFGMIGLWQSEGNYGYDPNVGPEQLPAIRTLPLNSIPMGLPPGQPAEAARIVLYRLNAAND